MRLYNQNKDATMQQINKKANIWKREKQNEKFHNVSTCFCIFGAKNKGTTNVMRKLYSTVHSCAFCIIGWNGEKGIIRNGVNQSLSFLVLKYWNAIDLRGMDGVRELFVILRGKWPVSGTSLYNESLCKGRKKTCLYSFI
jgi:hypothetical protein